MNSKCIHPLWVHLPAVAGLVILVVYILVSLPLPSSAGVHFGASGFPDRTGSPWEVFGITIGLSLLFIGLSIFFDELWARQESAKSFNWLSLFDDITVSALAGIAFGYLVYLNEGVTSFAFPWSYFLLFFGGVVVLAVVLETLRPFRPWHPALAAPASAALREDLARKLRGNAPFVYWDYQNPGYVTLLSTLLPLVMFAAAAVSWMEVVWVAILLIVVGLLLIIPYGGQRTLVTRESITVRWGIFGIPVLRLKMADIAAAEIREFKPMKDFGGYGIRFNREMKAYYLRGGTGVLFTLADGKKHLVGSDRPADLQAVVDAGRSA